VTRGEPARDAPPAGSKIPRAPRGLNTRSRTGPTTKIERGEVTTRHVDDLTPEARDRLLRKT
jgi:hypothetical protein